MMVADVLAPHRRQGIDNSHADSSTAAGIFDTGGFALHR